MLLVANYFLILFILTIYFLNRNKRNLIKKINKLDCLTKKNRIIQQEINLKLNYISTQFTTPMSKIK